MKQKNKEIDTILILKSEYDELIERSDWLRYLEDAGVDNWSGYSTAMEMQLEDRHES